MSKFKKILLGLVLLTVLGLLIFSYSILSQNFYKTENEIQERLSAWDIAGKIGYYKTPIQSLRFVQVGATTANKPVLMMIHGAPGSSSDFEAYWLMPELLDDYEVLSIDRPGFGPNTLREEDISIEDQAILLYELLESVFPGRKVALLSHSYGGPVGSVLASLLDTMAIGHVMVAPVMDPHSEEVFWYSSIPTIWPFSMVASNDWVVASLEKQKHVDQLMILKNRWSSIKRPTIHIHGTDDWLASYQNMAFCKAHFDSSYYSAIIIEQGSHFILWDDEVKKMIKDELLNLLMR